MSLIANNLAFNQLRIQIHELFIYEPHPLQNKINGNDYCDSFMRFKVHNVLSCSTSLVSGGVDCDNWLISHLQMYNFTCL